MARESRASFPLEFGLTFFGKRGNAFDKIGRAGAGSEAFGFGLQLIVEGGVKRSI